MDKKIVGILGAAAALTTMHAVQAAAEPAVEAAPAASYRDLLNPVPNALNALKADDARMAAGATEQRPVQTAQFYHHHHHHHHGFFPVVPGPYFRYHHHHHHHHHHGYRFYHR